MSKSKVAATGSGYVGEIMAHKISRSVGMVETVVEAQAGWPPVITLKLKDGSLKKGKLSEFREASGEEKKRFGEAGVGEGVSGQKAGGQKVSGSKK